MLIDDFGDGEGNPWDPEWGPYDHPAGGTISALLLNNSDTRAAGRADAVRLVGVFETNAGTPVVINNSTQGVEVSFTVTNSAMGVETDENGLPENFSGGPFRPLFSPF